MLAHQWVQLLHFSTRRETSSESRHEFEVSLSSRDQSLRRPVDLLVNRLAVAFRLALGSKIPDVDYERHEFEGVLRQLAHDFASCQPPILVDGHFIVSLILLLQQAAFLQCIPLRCLNSAPSPWNAIISLEPTSTSSESAISTNVAAERCSGAR